jgi:hypothetical protein
LSTLTDTILRIQHSYARAESRASIPPVWIAPAISETPELGWQHSMFLGHDANEFADASEGVSSFIRRRNTNFPSLTPDFDVG